MLYALFWRTGTIELKPLPYDDASLELIIFINEHGASKSLLYTGITADPERRIFGEHNVPRDKKDDHRVVRCESEDDARRLEKQLIASGCDGGPGGGDDDPCDYVYVYLKSDTTCEP